MARKTLPLATLALAAALTVGNATQAAMPAAPSAVVAQATEQAPFAQTVQFYFYHYQFTPYGYQYR